MNKWTQFFLWYAFLIFVACPIFIALIVYSSCWNFRRRKKKNEDKAIIVDQTDLTDFLHDCIDEHGLGGPCWSERFQKQEHFLLDKFS